MKGKETQQHIAIACGGTGGHLFPGVAVGEELDFRGWKVTYLVSPKEVDQQVVRAMREGSVITLPAVALQGGNLLGFLRATLRSHRAAAKVFKQAPPDVVLAMGGFTSAPPVLAGRALGAMTFLHESNTIPGRANRWLSHFVNECFVGFAEAAPRLWHPQVLKTGTPVRSQFEPGEPEGCRMMLNLNPDAPVLGIVGGSQGATGVNQLVLDALPELKRQVPGIQFAHLTGPNDADSVRATYETAGVRAWVQPFFSEMDLFLNACTAVVARAGASSLAEFAAVGLPAVLIPYPTASDNHQWHNARAIASSGAARVVLQSSPSQQLVDAVVPIFNLQDIRGAMQQAMRAWHEPDAARRMVDRMELLIRAYGRSPKELSQGVAGKGLGGGNLGWERVP